MGSTQGHTPGPWYVHDHQDDNSRHFDIRIPGNIGGHGPQIATVNPHRNGPSKGYAEAEDNARLIAAAPDLLAALKRCEAQIEVLMTWTRKDMAPLTAVCARDTQTDARAAIARAEGGAA